MAQIILLSIIKTLDNMNINTNKQLLQSIKKQKKHIINALVFFILTITLITCTNKTAKINKSKINEDFPVTTKIVDFDTILCMNSIIFNNTPKQMNIVDSVLIIQQIEGDKYFLFVNLKNKSIIKSWGDKGKGPNEFISISEFSLKDSCMQFMDYIKNQIVYVKVNEIIHQDSLKLLTKSYPNNMDFRPFKIYHFNQKKIVLGGFKNNRIGVLDKDNNIIGTFCDYPFPTKIKGIYRGATFQGMLGINETKNKFCSIIFGTDIFEIYSYKENNPQRIYISNFQTPNVRRINKSINIMNSFNTGIRGLSVTPDFIFLRYYYNKKNMETKEILCFDWNGNKKVKYIFPFQVLETTATNKFMYLITYDNENTFLLRTKI